MQKTMHHRQKKAQCIYYMIPEFLEAAHRASETAPQRRPQPSGHVQDGW